MNLQTENMMGSGIAGKEKKFIFIGIFLAVLAGIAIVYGYWVYLGMAMIGILLCWTVIAKPFMIYLLMVSLFSLEGFPSLPGVSYVKLVGVLLVGGLLLRLAVTKQSFPPDSSYKYFYMFFIGSLVSFAVAQDLSVSVKMYITYISLFMLYVLTRYFLRSIKDINRTLNYLILCTVIALLIVQIIGLQARDNYTGNRMIGGIGDPNDFASFILVLLPLVFYFANNSKGFLRFIYWGIFSSMIMMVIDSGSRGGMLGFCGAAGVLIYYYGHRRIKQIVIFFLILLVILYWFVPLDYWDRASTMTSIERQDSSMTLRIKLLKAAIEMFLDHPMIGVGIRNFMFHAESYGALKSQVVHNTYLEILTGGGVLSFIPFILILIISWQKLKLKRNYGENERNLLICLRASFVSILITSFFLSIDRSKVYWFLLSLISSSYYIAIQTGNTSSLIKSKLYAHT